MSGIGTTVCTGRQSGSVMTRPPWSVGRQRLLNASGAPHRPPAPCPAAQHDERVPPAEPVAVLPARVPARVGEAAIHGWRIMKTATGLTLLAVGAILAFAVRASPPGLNINARYVHAATAWSRSVPAGRPLAGAVTPHRPVS